MRIKLTLFNPRGDTTKIPPNYLESVQALIYQLMERNISEIIHDSGFTDPKTKRKFKLFTFSRLIPTKGSRLENGLLNLRGDIKLVIASPISDVMMSLATKVLLLDSIRIFDKNLIVKKVEIEETNFSNGKALVKTLSPITAYSTLLTATGKKKTYYYSPFEEEFSNLLIQNLVKKYRALTGKDVNCEGYIKPRQITKKDMKIVMYKGTVVKAWDGIFEVCLPPNLFKIAMEAGLGSKNSQGFGCLELLNGHTN